MKAVGYIVGDSVPLPRAFEPGAPLATETWPYLLAAADLKRYWVVNCCGSRTILELDEILKRIVYYYRPQVTIISLGIVDCAYRTLSGLELALVKKVPYLSQLLQPWLRQHHYFLTKLRRMPYTPPHIFRTRLVKALKFCQTIKTLPLYVSILPAGERMRSVSYDIEANISRYNQIVADLLPPEQIVDLRPLTARLEEYLLADGHHLNPAGHRACADLILARLQNIGDFQ